MPRDPAEVVTELHDLPSAADVEDPFVLVGHSLGGALDVLYARTYPDEVSGLVLVDQPLPPNRDLTDPAKWENVRVFALDQSLVPGYQLESYDLGTLFDEIDAAGPLQDIPVVVVRRGRMGGDPIPEGSPITQTELDALNASQWNSQAAWAAGAPGAALITVPDTTHYIQNQRPNAVVAAIRQAITGT
jgi:pimeloyl-ACP methyl ester carboxylesterase